MDRIYLGIVSHQGIANYDNPRPNRPPPQDLKELTAGPRPILQPRDLKCPMVDDKEVGYFYIPPKIPVHPKASADLILMCDFRDNHGGAGRAVMFANRVFRQYSEEDFQKRLQQPENAEFAQALRAAEGQ
jgi:hypothetical protein